MGGDRDDILQTIAVDVSESYFDRTLLGGREDLAGEGAIASAAEEAHCRIVKGDHGDIDIAIWILVEIGHSEIVRRIAGSAQGGAAGTEDRMLLAEDKVSRSAVILIPCKFAGRVDSPCGNDVRQAVVIDIRHCHCDRGCGVGGDDLLVGEDAAAEVAIPGDLVIDP